MKATDQALDQDRELTNEEIADFLPTPEFLHVLGSDSGPTGWRHNFVEQDLDLINEVGEEMEDGNLENDETIVPAADPQSILYHQGANVCFECDPGNKRGNLRCIEAVCDKYLCEKHSFHLAGLDYLNVYPTDRGQFCQ